jgi:hypothetical protein
MKIYNNFLERLGKITGMMLMTAGSCLLSCQNEDARPTPLMMLPEPEQATPVQTNENVVASGELVSFAHNTSGSVKVKLLQEARRVLILDDFTMNAGPDVYVMLSKSSNYSQATALPLVTLRATYDKSAVQVELKDEVNLSEYNYVIIYCYQYHSLFAFAELR